MKRENKQGTKTCGTQSKSNIHVIRVPKQEQENGAKAIFQEIMMEDFLKLIKDPLE